MNTQFQHRLKLLREKKGLSVKQMAEKLQVPITTYREWENGRLIQGEPYVSMAEVLEVSIYELLTGKPSPKVDQLIRQIGVIRNELIQLQSNLESLV